MVGVYMCWLMIEFPLAVYIRNPVYSIGDWSPAVELDGFAANYQSRVLLILSLESCFLKLIH